MQGNSVKNSSCLCMRKQPHKLHRQLSNCPPGSVGAMKLMNAKPAGTFRCSCCRASIAAMLSCQRGKGIKLKALPTEAPLKSRVALRRFPGPGSGDLALVGCATRSRQVIFDNLVKYPRVAIHLGVARLMVARPQVTGVGGPDSFPNSGRTPRSRPSLQGM